MLVNEGALVLKFWFHLTKDGQKRRLKAIGKGPAHRLARHQVELGPPEDLRQAAGRVGHVLRMTNTPWAPWIIVEGDRRPLSLADHRQDPARGAREAAGRSAGKLTTPGGAADAPISTAATC
jgi:hypothetical protein